VTRRTVSLLGSTGSIGVQAIDVIGRHPDAFDVIALAAVAVAREDAVPALRSALGDVSGVEIAGGADAVVEAARRGADVVLNGITGSVGLRPTLAALESGSTLALANKESLVAGGAIVAGATQRPDQIVPVDSEHSALAFRGWDRARLETVTPEQALKHPNWDMGPVVTINSATLVNKALEVIEAHWLFAMPYEQIKVVIHPQSVIHSMVEFVDGSTIAQASPPDMRLPIGLGLSWPERMDDVAPAIDWSRAHEWTFEPLDHEVFPAIALARSAAAASDLHPAVFNAANEQCVAAFAAGRLRFVDIVDTVRAVVEEFEAPGEITLAAVDEAEAFARRRADALISAR
jgi:1-deoxy-D-xylulose-5-phosphate reductoisomerase